MKRSTNFSHTRKRRNPLTDMALFLKDLGLSNDEIIEALTPMTTQITQEITHGDTGPTKSIKSLCGAKPNGVDYFAPVFADEPLPAQVNCPECIRKFEQWKRR